MFVRPETCGSSDPDTRRAPGLAGWPPETIQSVNHDRAPFPQDRKVAVTQE